MTNPLAELRALLPWPDAPAPGVARGPEPDLTRLSHPERARTLARLREAGAEGWERAEVLLNPPIPGRPDLALLVGGVPLAVALARETRDHAAAQLSMRAAPTTVLLVALGADGARLGTPARNFQFNPEFWTILPSLAAAAEAMHPRWLLERLALTALHRRGLLLPVLPDDLASSAAARLAWRQREDARLPAASTLVVALGLHRAGAPLLVLAASPARAAGLAGQLEDLGVPARCASSPDVLDAAPAELVRVSTAATAARAARPGEGVVLLEGSDRRERRLRARGWGPFLYLPG